MLRSSFGDSAPFAILLRGPAAGARTPGPGADPRPAPRPQGHHPLPLGPGLGAAPAPQPAPGADPRRLPRRPRPGGQRNRPQAQPHPRRTDPRTGARDPVGLRQHLAGAPGRVDLRQRARRADRDPGPADRPPARLPLAGRRRDPARLRRDHRVRLAGNPLRDHLVARHRRLRPHRLHDDGAGAGSRLLAADGLPLPRGARQGRRHPSTPLGRRGARPGARPCSPAARC